MDNTHDINYQVENDTKYVFSPKGNHENTWCACGGKVFLFHSFTKLSPGSSWTELALFSLFPSTFFPGIIPKYALVKLGIEPNQTNLKATY